MKKIVLALIFIVPSVLANVELANDGLYRCDVYMFKEVGKRNIPLDSFNQSGYISIDNRNVSSNFGTESVTYKPLKQVNGRLFAMGVNTPDYIYIYEYEKKTVYMIGITDNAIYMTFTNCNLIDNL
ncbi:TPA: hypothetical protein NV808_004269 [Escherichia coli]|nr:hypothetical protein [Escherichia coli]HCJ8888871.1 hypothetical protein [Escherichia coli]